MVVRSDVWEQQPPSQTISISREKLSQPSTWAVFPFTTPDAGGVVSIEILLLYQGKPLQAATYVSPVRAHRRAGRTADPDDVRVVRPRRAHRRTATGRRHARRPWCRPRARRRQRRQSAHHRRPGDARPIEDRVSRVLGMPGAPDSFDDSRAVELLITLARIGTELDTFLAPLDLGDARQHQRHHQPRHPRPAARAGLRRTPTARQAPSCATTSRTLRRPVAPATKRRPSACVRMRSGGSIARSHAPSHGNRAGGRRRRRGPRPCPRRRCCTRATVIADDGASEPLPTDSVLTAAAEPVPAGHPREELDGVAQGRQARQAEPAGRARPHDGGRRRDQPLHRQDIHARPRSTSRLRSCAPTAAIVRWCFSSPARRRRWAIRSALCQAR